VSVGAVAPGTAARPAVDDAAAPWRRVSLLAVGGTVLAGIVLPWLLVRLSIGDYLVTLLILFFMQAVVAQSWNLIMGYGGIYSFAQVALFAVGGWATAVLATSLGWNPFIAILFSPPLVSASRPSAFEGSTSCF
jgi:branched-chain amino acid transport system permease protein